MVGLRIPVVSRHSRDQNSLREYLTEGVRLCIDAGLTKDQTTSTIISTVSYCTSISSSLLKILIEDAYDSAIPKPSPENKRWWKKYQYEILVFLWAGLLIGLVVYLFT